MWLGQQTVSSLERCPSFRVSFIERSYCTPIPPLHPVGWPRVWDTSQWTCEQWTNLANPCTAAAWSPTGETLLFALRDDPAIYCVSFPPEGCAGKAIHGTNNECGYPLSLSLSIYPYSISSFQCSEVCGSVLCNRRRQCVSLASDCHTACSETPVNPPPPTRYPHCLHVHPHGPLIQPFLHSLGTVKDLVWDPSGEKLAAIFEGAHSHTSTNANLHVAMALASISFSDYHGVAILHVRLTPVVEVVFGYVGTQQ